MVSLLAFAFTPLLAPNDVAVMGLDTRPSNPTPVEIAKSFIPTAKELLSTTVVEADSTPALLGLYDCKETSSECLGKIASSLQVGYLLFGTSKLANKQLMLSLSVYDKASSSILATEEIALRSGADKESMNKLLVKLFDRPTLRTLAKPTAFPTAPTPEPAKTEPPKTEAPKPEPVKVEAPKTQPVAAAPVKTEVAKTSTNTPSTSAALTPAAPQKPSLFAEYPWLRYTPSGAFALSALGFAVATELSLHSIAEDEVRTPEERSKVRRFAAISDVSLALSAVSLIFTLDKKNLSVSPTASAGSAGLVITLIP